MEDKDLLARVPELLLDWYDGHARVLPWREDPAPYRVWVSEIMLQQTRVEAVKPYYQRFLEQLPTVADLAAVSEPQLLKLWEGLGYYNRARNLQKGAQAVMERYGGELPADFDALRALPGIGEYTAGAIASIAFQLPCPAVDGNVLRVISRLLNRTDNILDPRVKRRTTEEIRGILPRRAGDFNQSLMELGATVCLPGGPPKCGECPLQGLCKAHALGTEQTLPVKAKAKPRKVQERTVFLLTCKGRLALRRRPDSGLLAGLWELPAAEGRLDARQAGEVLESWGIVLAGKLAPGNKQKHIFSHIEWRMTAWKGEAAEPVSSFVWADGGQLAQNYALPSAFKGYFPDFPEKLTGGD